MANSNIEEKTNAFSELLSKHGVEGLLVAIVCIFLTMFTDSMKDLTSQVTAINVRLTKIQTELVNANEIRAIVKEQIATHEAIYHHTSVKSN